MKYGVELIERLALCFGPTSCEGEVEQAIREELAGTGAILETDRMGNLTAHLAGPEGAPRIMLSAHMDEVGFMITHIEEKGYLRFEPLGGIDPAVLSGRAVTLGDETKRIPGVIAAKGIHQQSAKERKELPKTEDLYIDIGTNSREETEKVLERGDFGTFDTPFCRFGKDGAFIKCKALDDRLGCAVLIEVLRALDGKKLPLDLWFCFTVREEIGKSGAGVTANRIAPDYGIILETTAIADVADVDPSRRVATVGEGGVLSLLDRSTIYDRALIDFALNTGAKNAIPVQVKRYVSGGNDAAHIQRSGIGVRCLALSAATRYLHAPVSVASVKDFESMIALLIRMLSDWKEGIK
ncbi:MAG: M20/M25/M40 family metallo-hydrolase [Clostridia bacterium]|nr:M20/M25/M40 family metallo-hydrolase [Clostridia bacterium]